MSRIDLHAHTQHSDGTLTATALVRLAHEVGLSLLAVTDHDTTSALAEAQAEGARLGVQILAGCEVTTRLSTGIAHILGYGFDPASTHFQHFLARVREARDRRNDRMFERLAELGVPLTREEVAVHVHGRILARPHFARALVERGYVRDLRGAFSLYLRDGGPAYVEAAVPPPQEALAAIRAAGGVGVLAHPVQLKLADRAAYVTLLRALHTAGLSGVEVWHPSQDADARALFASLAQELDLVPSGGSDFHGDAKPHIRLGSGDGTIEMRRPTWDLLDARRAPHAA